MPRRRLLLALPAVALVCYAVFLFRNLSYAAGGPDTAGYLNEARLIASGRVTRPVRLLRELGLDDSWLPHFTPLGFAPSRHAQLVPTYPAGTAMHIALAGRVGGWERAPFFIGPLAAIGAAAFLFAIARRLGLSLFASMAAAASLAFMPPLLWHVVQPASDVLATFWTLAAMLCALRAAERPSPALAALAGAAFGVGVWVRPTNLLLALAFAFALRWRPRLLVAAAAGALPFGLGLLWWNATLYGGALKTGYHSLLAESMSWRDAARTAPRFSAALARMMTPLVFPLGLLVAFDRRVETRTRWMLLAWFLPFFVFYSFYGWFDSWQSVRFLLPAVPALLLGTLLLLRRVRIVAAVLALLIALAPLWFSHRLGVIHLLPLMEKGYPQYVAWAEERIPRRAMLVTGVLSGAFVYYADRDLIRYDTLDDVRFQELRAYAGMAGLPWYAALSDHELDHAQLEQRFRGKWTQVGRFETITLYRIYETPR